MIRSRGVFLNGVAMTPGTYTAAQLTALNAAAFPASWPEQTGSSVSNSSGSLRILTSPPPVFSQDISPLTLTVYPSQTAQFTVTVVATPPVTYHWAVQQRESERRQHPLNLAGSQVRAPTT